MCVQGVPLGLIGEEVLIRAAARMNLENAMRSEEAIAGDHGVGDSTGVTFPQETGRVLAAVRGWGKWG